MSVFSSKGGSGKTFLTTNLATAIAQVTGQDTAVVDLDVDMGDVFTYFGREPSASISDLMELGEGADGDQIRSVGVEVAPHVWAFGAPPDPAAEAPAGEAIGKFLRSIRSEFDYVVVDASVDYSDSALVCFDLSDMICLVTGLDVVGVKHLSKALDTLLTIGLPRERFRVVLNRADSKVGLDAVRRGTRHEDPRRRHDPVEPSRPDLAQQGSAGRARRAEVRGVASIRQLAIRFAGATTRPRRNSSAGAQRRREEERGPVRPEVQEVIRRHPPMSLADRLAKAQQKDRIADVRGRVQERLVESLGPRLYDATMSDTELEGLVHQRLRELLDEEEGPLSAQEKLLIVRQIGDSVLGLGPLEPFVRDPEVTEIMVNNWDTIYVERAGKLYWTGTKFHDEQQLRRTIDKIVGKVGRRVDEARPYVDARLPDGSRVNAVIPPLSIDGPALTIRKFAADPYQADDLIEFGTMTSPVAKFLEACVRGRINIMVAGGTGAGKTTTLNVISSFIPDDERILTIEDAAELKLQQPHVVRLESRPPNIEGKGQVSIRDLVRNSLRMRPDRIVVGEVRGAEALDMLQAMNTGHDGSISTIHCNSPRDALCRLETITMMAGMELSNKAIREQIASALQLIVYQQRLKDGTRRFTHVTEVAGMEGEVITLQDIFLFDFSAGMDEEGRFRGRLEVDRAAAEVPGQARRARRVRRARALRDGAEGGLMLASSPSSRRRSSSASSLAWSHSSWRGSCSGPPRDRSRTASGRHGCAP